MGTPSAGCYNRQLGRLLVQGAPGERPDGLVITDDNLVPDLTAGLAESGVKDVVVAHTNFPHPTPSAVPGHAPGVRYSQTGGDLHGADRPAAEWGNGGGRDGTAGDFFGGLNRGTGFQPVARRKVCQRRGYGLEARATSERWTIDAVADAGTVPEEDVRTEMTRTKGVRTMKTSRIGRGAGWRGVAPGLLLALLLAAGWFSGFAPQAEAVSATGGTVTNYTDAGGSVEVLVVAGGGGDRVHFPVRCGIPMPARTMTARCCTSGIDMIQWVPGAGAKPLPEWRTELRQIQSLGKGLWLNGTGREVIQMMEYLRPEGCIYRVECGSRDEADMVIKACERLYGCRVSAS